MMLALKSRTSWACAAKVESEQEVEREVQPPPRAQVTDAGGAMKHRKFKVEKSAHPRGWTDWIYPNTRGYWLACCDCALVHEVQFRAIGCGPQDKRGAFKARDLPPSKYRVKMRVRRANGYTARLRARDRRSALASERAGRKKGKGKRCRARSS